MDRHICVSKECVYQVITPCCEYTSSVSVFSLNY